MESLYAVPAEQPDPIEQVSNALRLELAGLFQVTNVATRSRGQVISFGGRLLHDPDASYDEIRRRFRRHGYTPMLRQEKGEDVILAMEGLVDRAKTGNPLINVGLFAATVLTTLTAGATLADENLFAAVTSGSTEAILSAILAGAPFAIALLGILGIHELGHYFAAHWHGVRATLPYFIPVPPVPFGGIGTLGAFIAIRSPMKDRKVLFDIGLAGPYAGFMVAVPLLMIGLLLSTSYQPLYASGGLTLNDFGTSILVKFFVIVLTNVPAGQTLVLHPIFFAAWLGIFLTGINLLPVGQLDGGHAAYALLGRSAHTVAIITFFLLILAGALFSLNWFIWAFFIMLGGLRHPPPLNDVTDVGPLRKLIGAFTIILFVLIFTPVPF